MDLAEELSEMSNLLKDLQKGTKSLLAQSQNKLKPPPTLEQKRTQATSSWAKSSTPKVADRIKYSAANSSTSQNVEHAHNVIRTKTPVYSIGKAPRMVECENSATKSVPAFYDSNITALSTYKKAKTVSFGSVKAATSNSKHVQEDINAEAIENDSKDKLTSQPANPSTTQITISKGYSFGKAPRNIQNLDNNSHGSVEGTPPPLILDTDKAEKYLRGNASAPIMKAPLPPSTRINKDAKEETSSSNNNPDIKPIESSTNAYEKLSHHITAPAFTISKPSTESSSIHIQLKNSRMASLVGPGYYVTKDDMFENLQKRKNHGKIYHSSSSSSKRPQSANALSSRNQTATPGPGYYNTEESEQKLRFQAPRPVAFGIPQNSSDAKSTPQLERKRYREEKLMDIRDFHDNREMADDSFLRPRTPSVRIVPPEAAVLASSASHIQHRIRMERKYEEEKRKLDALAAEKASGGINHNFVEPRSRVMVSMAAEVKSRESLSKFISAKPGVVKVKADKLIAEFNRDVLYGPQLPVQWVPEIEISDAHRDNLDLNETGAGDFSPTADVQRLLHDRHSSSKKKDTLNYSKRGSMDWTNANTTAVSATAKAYLQSSLSGNIASKATVVYKPIHKDDSSHAVQDSISHEFVGPQLPIDWKEMQQHQKKQSIRMDLSRGRDDIRIHRKGIVEIREFTTHVIPKYDELGPGVYAKENILDEFTENMNNAVTFDKMTSRQNVVGPRGEKPENARIALSDILDDPLYADSKGVPDIDYGAAKDAATARKESVNTMKLYLRDRYEPEPEVEPIGNEGTGGEEREWFKGMYDELQSKKTTALNFDRMRGREIDKDDMDVWGDGEDGQLIKAMNAKVEIEVTDWNPSMPRTQTFEFRDATKYPRFENQEKEVHDHSVAVDETGKFRDVEAAKVHLSGYREQPNLVWMDKMRGRVDNEKESGAVRNDVLGDDDLETAVRLEVERENRLRAAQEIVGISAGKLKRTPVLVDMGKQIGREDRDKEQNLANEAVKSDGGDPENSNQRSPVKDRSGIGNAPVKGGAGDWSKTKSTRESKDSENRKVEKLIGAEQEEVEVDLDGKKYSKLSRYSSTKTGPSWDSTLHPNSKQGHDRFPVVKLSAAHDSDYSDVDPGKFKKGFAPLGSKPGGVSYSKQQGRSDDAKMLSALREVIGEDEEVDINPSDDALKAHVRGTSMGRPPVKATPNAATATVRKEKVKKPNNPLTDVPSENREDSPRSSQQYILPPNKQVKEPTKESYAEINSKDNKSTPEQPIPQVSPIDLSGIVNAQIHGTSDNVQEDKALSLSARESRLKVEPKDNVIRNSKSSAARRREMERRGSDRDIDSDLLTSDPITSENSRISSISQTNKPEKSNNSKADDLYQQTSSSNKSTRPGREKMEKQAAEVASPVFVSAPAVGGIDPHQFLSNKYSESFAGHDLTSSQILEKLDEKISSLNI